jgi:pyrroline-5-carboxylate reductase
MNTTIGFIGCGKMAGAIVKGIITSGFAYVDNIKGSEVSTAAAQWASESLGIEVGRDNRALVRGSDVIVLAVKPMYAVQILEEIKSVVNSNKLIISIVAGLTTQQIENILPDSKVIRVMPNTPALVLDGMSGVTRGRCATEADIDYVINLLSNIGQVLEIDESQMDILTAISGSGPAFFYKVIEDIARAGEKLGLEYEKSLLLAAQTAAGAAKMVKQRGNLSVQDLIDNVATPGGCTFEGVQEMKDSDRLFFEVIKATAKKSSELIINEK